MLIIGVGNRERRDDGVGLEVAAKLREDAPDGCRVVEFSGGPMDMIDLWEGAEAVVAIDATSSEAEPGTVRRIDAVSGELPDDLFHCSTHSFGIAEAAELARALDRMPPSFVIYGVEGRYFGIGEELSSAVAEKVDEVVERVLEEVS